MLLDRGFAADITDRFQDAEEFAKQLDQTLTAASQSYADPRLAAAIWGDRITRDSSKLREEKRNESIQQILRHLRRMIEQLETEFRDSAFTVEPSAKVHVNQSFWFHWHMGAKELGRVDAVVSCKATKSRRIVILVIQRSCMGEHALFQTIEKVGGGFCFEGIGIPEHRLTRLWEFDPLQPPSSEVLSQVIDTAVATAIDQLGEEACAG